MSVFLGALNDAQEKELLEELETSKAMNEDLYELLTSLHQDLEELSGDYETKTVTLLQVSSELNDMKRELTISRKDNSHLKKLNNDYGSSALETSDGQLSSVLEANARLETLNVSMNSALSKERDTIKALEERIEDFEKQVSGMKGSAVKSRNMLGREFARRHSKHHTATVEESMRRDFKPTGGVWRSSRGTLATSSDWDARNL